MIALFSTVVDTAALLKTVLASLAASIGVTLAFSLAIFGATRATEASRDGKLVAAGAGLVLMLLMLAVCAGAVVVGFIVMTSK